MPLGDDGELLEPVPLSKPKRRPLTNPQRMARAFFGFLAIAIPVAVLSLGLVLLLSRPVGNNAVFVTTTPGATSSPTPTSPLVSDCIKQLSLPRLIVVAGLAFLQPPPDDSPLQTHIYMTDASGSSFCLLAKAAKVYLTRWLPDRQQIVWSGMTGEKQPITLFVMNPDGTNLRSLFPGEPIAYDRLPPWSGTAHEFVLDGRTPNGQGADNGWLLHSDTDGAQAGRWLKGQSPSWSPDGRYLLYSDAGRWFITDAAGRSPRPITPADPKYANPVWTADSQHILMSYYNQNAFMITLHLDASGSDIADIKAVPPGDALAVTQNDGQLLGLINYDPQTQTFSPYLPGLPTNMVYPDKVNLTVGHVLFAGPDDQHIYIVIYDNNSRTTGLYLTNLEGTDVKLVSVKEIYKLSWLPNHKQLSFLSGGSIWILNPDGSNLRAVPNPTGLEISAFAWISP